jgi:hypothetical protein
MMKRTGLLLVVAALLCQAACSSGANDEAGDVPGSVVPDGKGNADGAFDDVRVDPDVKTVPPDGTVGELPTGDSLDPDPKDGNVQPPKDLPHQEIPEGHDTLEAEAVVAIPDFQIKIAKPQSNTTRSGAIEIRIVPLEVAELALDSLSVKVDDYTVFYDSKVPTSFILDTTQYDDGPLSIEASASLGEKSAEDAVEVVLENAPFGYANVYAEEDVYRDGDEVTLMVKMTKPGLDIVANFSHLDSEYAEGDEEVYEIGGGKYMVTHTISENNVFGDGLHMVPVSVSDGEFTLEHDHLFLSLQNLPGLPFRVAEGIFVTGPPPMETAGWTDVIELVYGNDFVITGGSAKVNVDFSEYAYPAEIIGVIFALNDHAGHYQVPLAGSIGEEEILLLMRAFVDDEQPPGKLPLRIALRDVRGRISPYVGHELSVQTVGSGDIQVSVSFDTDTDVDLHVVEPAGCEIYYGNDYCGSGGWLDLDSNPACSMDYVNNENIYWPEGQAPEGTYIVRVDFYEDCCWCGANYTVTIHYCGDMEIYEGHFAAGTDDSGGAGDGVTVATFSNENCGRVLRGRVRYEDRTFDRHGFLASTWKPARYATVELHRASDNELLATGWTDRWGRYEIQFSNKEEPGVYIVVKSMTNLDEGLRSIAVMNHPKFQLVYSVPSLSVDETETDFPILNFDIPEVVGAGAFNILDVLVDGYDLIRLMTGKDLGVLNSYWATGADTTDTLYCSQYFYEQGICSEKGALAVQGKDTDRDEYDDMVVQKEFFKFALEQVSLDDNPGGKHDGTRDDPRRSWSEGISTFFACDVSDYKYFVNSRPFGVYLVQEMELLDSPFGFGTSNGAMSGELSEFLVGAVLWDLRDDEAEDESFDLIEGQRLGIYDSVFNYFPTFHFADRGAVGVDFVDFLDGWFCRDWGEEETVTPLLEQRQFPYDFEGPGLCIH